LEGAERPIGLDNGIPRPALAQLLEEPRKIVVWSREVLKEPMPDTFLGRKTQEPFPNQDENE